MPESKLEGCAVSTVENVAKITIAFKDGTFLSFPVLGDTNEVMIAITKMGLEPEKVLLEPEVCNHTNRDAQNLCRDCDCVISRCPSCGAYRQILAQLPNGKWLCKDCYGYL